MNFPQGQWIVVRSHSWTDRQQLFKAISRPLARQDSAIMLMESEADAAPEYEFAVIKVVAIRERK